MANNEYYHLFGMPILTLASYLHLKQPYFNFNPFLIDEISEFTIKNVTVDGILLSDFSKQKYLSLRKYKNLYKLSFIEYSLSRTKPLLPIEYEADNQAMLSFFEYYQKRI